MPLIEKLTIFLASPGDVATERRLVEQVVEEVNRLPGPGGGVVLQVVRWEKDTFPGYGADAQSLVNAQIAQMEQYDLFVGIMWNRVGTRTPRASSGTIEEFERAVDARKRSGRPEIWFYFRTSPATLNTAEQLDQRRQVIEFKARVRGNGMPWDYDSPTKFKDLFRGHLLRWLSSRTGARVATAGVPTVRQPKASRAAAKRPDAAAEETAPLKRRGAVGVASKPGTLRSNASKAASTVAPTAPRRQTGGAGALASSGDLMLLGETFFRTQSVSHKADDTIVVRIPAGDSEHAAALRALRPDPFGRSRQMAYAYQDEAHRVDVRSVESESVSGKTFFVVSLTPETQSRGGWSVGEATVQGYSPDELALMRARFLLLNEAPAGVSSRDLTWVLSLAAGRDAGLEERGLFPRLWKQLGLGPAQFLPRARLMAVFQLKIGRIVEDVLDLRLGPIRNGALSVRFRGRRQRIYENQAPATIEVTGTCPLT
jgi:hypothetical protein